MRLILIGVLITLFTNTIMAQKNKNINYKSAMTSNEAYTYTPKKENIVVGFLKALILINKSE